LKGGKEERKKNFLECHKAHYIPRKIIKKNRRNYSSRKWCFTSRSREGKERDSGGLGGHGVYLGHDVISGEKM